MAGERTSTEVRLDAQVERGLERYGEGDLDGAINEWENVLAVDPGNRRANEYVDYVRQNYDLLAEQFRLADETAGAQGIPLGASDDGDLDAYDLVELETGARSPSAVPPVALATAQVESVDEGWFIGDEGTGADSLPPPPEPRGLQRGLTAELELGAVAAAVMGSRQGDAGDHLDPPSAAPDGDGDDDDDASYQDGIIELEAELPEEGTRGGFELGADDAADHRLELMPEDREHDLDTDDQDEDERAATDGLDFGSPGLTQERTVELRTAQLAGAPDGAGQQREEAEDEDGEDEDEDEATVPGGEEPPPFGDGQSLSEEALVALSAGVRPSVSHQTRRPDETTAERSSLGSAGFDLPDLDELDLAAPPDDRRDEDSAVRVTFRSEGTGTGRGGGRQHDDEEGELTVERPAGRAGGSERLPFAADEELTREREPGSWDRGLLSLGDDLGEDATREHRAAPELADTLELGSLELDTPQGEPALGELEEPTGWHRSGTANEATVERRSQQDFDHPSNQHTGDMPAIDIGMAPLTDESMSMDAIGARLDAEIDGEAPADEGPDDRTRRRVAALIKRAESEANLGQASTAVTALDMALDEDPDSAIAQKVIHRHRDLLFEIYRGYIGDMRGIPALAIPLHQLAQEQLDNRAAFLLSRIDGTLSFEEILDVAGMTRLEAYRLLSRMLLRGILEVH